jgi:hypothetical protein
VTLILAAVAALIAAAIRFAKPDFGIRWRLGSLALMYLAAALMWSVDGIASLIEGGPFVELSDPAVVADDTLLGVAVLALGLIVWGAFVLIKRVRKPASV